MSSLNTHELTKKEFRQIISRTKASAKKRGIDFSLTTADLDYVGIPLTCPVLDIPIYFYKGTPKEDSLSIDRIDSSKGYTRDNITIVSYRVNKIKSNATLEELTKILHFYQEL